MRGPIVYRFASYTLDIARGMLLRQGRRAHLPQAQFAILAELVVHAGEILSREALLEAAWGSAPVGLNSVDQAVSRLRRRFGDEVQIETSPSRGYLFATEVQQSEQSPTDAVLAVELAPFVAFGRGVTELHSLDRAGIQRARHNLEGSIKEAPDYWPTHVKLAMACAFLFEASTADPQPDTATLKYGLDHARIGCERLPKSAEAWSTLAFLLHLDGDSENAVAAARKATGLDPADWHHWMLRSYVSSGEERSRAAREVLNRCGGLRIGLGQVLQYRTMLSATDVAAESVLAVEYAVDDLWVDVCSRVGVILTWPPDWPRLGPVLGRAANG